MLRNALVALTVLSLGCTGRSLILVEVSANENLPEQVVQLEFQVTEPRTNGDRLRWYPDNSDDLPIQVTLGGGSGAAQLGIYLPAYVTGEVWVYLTARNSCGNYPVTEGAATTVTPGHTSGPLPIKFEQLPVHEPICPHPDGGTSDGATPDGGGSDAGAGDASPDTGAGPTCGEYCELMTANCPLVFPNNDCPDVCAQAGWPSGTLSFGENSIGCRLLNAQGAVGSLQEQYCAQASPTSTVCQ